MARFPQLQSWLGWFLGTGAVVAGTVAAVGAIYSGSGGQWLWESPNPSGFSTSVLASTVSPTGSSSSKGRAQFGVFKGDRDPVKDKGVRRSQVVRLENGLTVVTRPLRTAPVVSVQVWYRVGTRNEGLRQSGMAHVLEHLLFKGTRSRPVQFGRLFSALGSESNGFTGYDSTAYVNTAERGQLEALLTLEADRMTGAALTKMALEQERSVVLSELAGYGNDPAFRLDEAVMARAFPGLAIGQPIGGTVAGVEGLTEKDLRGHYRRFYRPDNAVLTIVGNFDQDQAFALVRRLFGSIPATSNGQGPAVAGERGEPGLAKAVVQQIEQVQEPGQDTQDRKQDTLDPLIVPGGGAQGELSGVGTVSRPLTLAGGPGAQPLVQMVYPMPEAGHGDEAALLVLSRVLATGRRSLLNQELVEQEEPLAQAVDGLLFHGVDRGWYQLVAEPMPEMELRTVQRRVLSVVERVRSQRVQPGELERAKVLVRSQILLEGRDVTSQGMRLGQDCLIMADCEYRDRMLVALDQVTPAEVRRVARVYLNPERLTVGWLVASAEGPALAEGGEWLEEERWDRRSRFQQPHHSPMAFVDELELEDALSVKEVKQFLPAVGFEASVEVARQGLAIAPEVVELPNGLQVLLVRDDSTPTVTVAGYVPAGRQWDPMNRAGVAELVALGLWAGSGDRSEGEFAQALESRGIQLDIQPHREGAVVTGQGLADQEQDMVRLLGDWLRRPQFDPVVLERDRQRSLTNLQARLDSPSYIARQRVQELMYPPGHPFRIFATDVTLNAITRQDLQEFHQKHYRPNGTVLAIIGDIDPGRLRQVIAETFADWERSPAPPLPTSQTAKLPNKLQYLHRAIATKSQAITVMGYPGITRTDPRYYPALILNQILGGDTLASRLGRLLRDRHGLTYGVYSQFQAGQQAGPFSIDFQTAPEDTQTAIHLTRQELRNLRQTGVTPEEVTAAKQALVRHYPVALADPDVLAEYLVTEWVQGLPPEELAQFGDRINSVTVAQVNQAIQQLIHPDKLAIVSAGPPKAAKFP